MIHHFERTEIRGLERKGEEGYPNQRTIQRFHLITENIPVYMKRRYAYQVAKSCLV